MPHEKQISLLKSDLENGNLAHAYLFYGPRGIGKFSAACDFANLIQKGHSNLDKIELVDDGSSLKILEIRDLVGKVFLSKQSEFKVILIENIERVTPEAANSLLKTLEEPPAGTIFILTSGDLSKVIPTIISRCRLIRFGISDFNYEEEDLSEIEALIFESGIVEKFNYLENIVEEKVDINLFLRKIERVLRLKLLNSSSDLEKNKVLHLLNTLDKTLYLLQSNVNTKVVLENFLLTF